MLHEGGILGALMFFHIPLYLILYKLMSKNLQSCTFFSLYQHIIKVNSSVWHE